MSHRFHPDPELDDDPEAILWDDCEDCTERAQLWGLDDANLRRAFERMIFVERGGGAFYRSSAEKELCTLLHRGLMAFERLGLIDERGVLVGFGGAP